MHSAQKIQSIPQEINKRTKRSLLNNEIFKDTKSIQAQFMRLRRNL